MNYLLSLSLSLVVFFTAFGLPTQAAWGHAPDPTQANSLLGPHLAQSFWGAGLLPLQAAGRSKPLDSFAREFILFETGSRNYKNWDPVDFLLSCLAFPAQWSEQPIILLAHQGLKRQLLLDEKRKYFSPSELLENPALAQYAERVQQNKNLRAGATAAAKPRSESEQDKELAKVLDRVSLFHSLIAGSLWKIIPVPSPGEWESIVHPDALPDALKDVLGSTNSTINKPTDSAWQNGLRKRFAEWILAYQQGQFGLFQTLGTQVREQIEERLRQEEQQQTEGAGSWGASLGVNWGIVDRLHAEVAFNRFRPFWVAALFYFFGIASCLFLTKRPSIAVGFTSLAFLSHTAGFVLRCFAANRPPVTNMYESVVWVSFGAVAMGGVLFYLQEKKQRKLVILGIANLMALLAMLAADLAPTVLDPSIQPLMPVLRSNFWLTIHVLIITLSYAAFALSFGLANLCLFYFLRSSSQQGNESLHELTRKKITSLNQLNYRAIQFGVVLIAAGTILGGIWADQSWGRFWGWDPKEVWALITLLLYIGVLHGRYTAWVGPFSFAVYSALSFLSVLMAWYGVNFILGVGLHSYGFSTGGSSLVFSFVGTELVYLAAVSFFYLRKPPNKPAPPWPALS